MVKEQGLLFINGYCHQRISVGKYLVNVDTKDYGMYQTNIKTVISRQNAPDTSWNRNVYAMKLITDFQFATKMQ